MTEVTRDHDVLNHGIRPVTNLNFSYLKRPLLQFKIGDVKTSYLHNKNLMNESKFSNEKQPSSSNLASDSTKFHRFERKLMNNPDSPERPLLQKPEINRVKTGK